MSDRRDELLAEGFALVDTRAVALPHYVWKVDLEIEMDRELRLLEETVLGLVAAGIGDPDRIGKLVGDAVIAGPAIVDLLRVGAIGRRDDRLQINPNGQEMLHRALARETKTEDVLLRHDPYADALRWSFDESELREDERAAAGLRALPTLPALERADLEARIDEVQQLLTRDGLPFDHEDLRARNREAIRLVAKKCLTGYREVQLEVWRRDDTDEWRWRLLRGDGGEDRAVSERLEQLEATKDAVVIPLEDAPREPQGVPAQEIAAAVSNVASSGRAKILATHEHRPALRDALREAQRELIIVSPWLATAAIDGELLGWIDHALRAQKQLRIRIGFGIEPVGKTKRAPRDQEDALRRLRQIGERTRGRLELVEIGNTHEKIVICDESYAIVTSFNFLSFKPRPGRGIRLERGVVVEDAATVRQLRKSVIEAMASAR